MSVFLYNERPLVTPSVRWGWLKQRTSDTEGWRGKSSTEIDAAPPPPNTLAHISTGCGQTLQIGAGGARRFAEKNPNE